ncbi:MAG: MFS transporter, partial [Dehalococcoidia bacterium]
LRKRSHLQLLPRAVHQLRGGFHGWRILGLMLGPRAAGVGIYVFGNTLFILPLEESLGIPRTISSLLFALGILASGLASLVSGILIDRFGPRKVLLVSVITSSAGYVLFGLSTHIVILFIAFLGPISLTVLNVTFNSSSGIINNWFERYKATAFSVLQAGAGLGAFFIVPLLAFSIDQWDWRAGAMLAAAVIIVLGLPAYLFSRDTPEEMGLRPDGDRPIRDTSPEHVSRGQGGGLTTREAIRTPSFWFLIASAIFFGGGAVGVQVHFVPIMVWKGVDEVQAGLMLTVMALAGMPLVLLAGWFADRIDRLIAGAGVCAAVGLGVLIINLSSPGWVLWLAVPLFATHMGIFAIAWAAVGEMFGRRAYSTIRGGIMAAQSVCNTVVPVLFGVLYDRTDDYTIALWLAVGLWAGAGLLLAITPRRRAAA